MLSKQDIEKELGKGINIFPLHRDNIKENSINFTIGKNAWALGSGSIVKCGNTGYCMAKERDSLNNNALKKKYISFGESAIIKDGKASLLVLLPHTTTIVETSEVIAVDKYIGGTVHSKVGIVAQGVGHIGTMLGPCFCGHLMISLHNITDKVITIPVGDTFISVVFHHLDTPIEKEKNSNISGHVDKLAELGIKIDTGTREFLTQDWKLHVDGIRNKMIDSEEYKAYKRQCRKDKTLMVKRYLNLNNIVLAVILICVVMLLGAVATYIDQRSGNNLWSERFWTVVITGIIVPVLMRILGCFKKS